jgi:predicted AAA+ superfamily ATPase
MYSRLLKPPKQKSFFLFGPRGTGKTTWVKTVFPEALCFDLLEARHYNSLLADPQRLDALVPDGFKDWVVLDEVQKIPAILDEVHRLIEKRRLKFVLTSSSARKLRRGAFNLLGGRALTFAMHPLAAAEMGSDFDLGKALRFGLLPAAPSEADPRRFLESYVHAYLEQEVKQEGLTRNLAAFARFLEAASFSQGGVLNMSAVARECSVERKVVESYFGILDDLLIAHLVPAFTRRSKRRIASHPKFYFFDTGVFRALRPTGPLDAPEEAEGPAFETLLLQNLLAVNDALGLGYKIHYWRTVEGFEVDFILYGVRGLLAFEVKRRGRVDKSDASGLRAFLKDYPAARAILAYGGEQRIRLGAVDAWPMASLLMALPALLAGKK